MVLHREKNTVLSIIYTAEIVYYDFQGIEKNDLYTVKQRGVLNEYIGTSMCMG